MTERMTAMDDAEKIADQLLVDLYGLPAMPWDPREKMIIANTLRSYAEARVREAQTEMYWQPREVVRAEVLKEVGRGVNIAEYNAGYAEALEKAAKVCTNYPASMQKECCADVAARIELDICALKEKAMKYRKRPVIVEAYRTMVAQDIETLEGTMHANAGDWIVTGVKGESYPVKPDIFEATYEKVGE